MTIQAIKIPKGWKETTFGEVAVLNYGEGLKFENRTHGKIPVYGSGGVTGFHNEALVEEPGYIIGRKGTVGSIYYSLTPFFPIDTVYYTTKKDIKCDFNFFYYLLKTLGLEKLNFDSAVPGLSRSMAYSLQIKIPINEFEQRAIAAVLSSLDNKIALLRKQNKTLEATAQAIFKKWFDKNNGKLPEGWRVGELSEIADIDWGNTNMTKREYVKNGKYLGVSAAGCDGRVNQKEYDYGAVVISAIGEYCGTIYLPIEDFTAIKNTLVVRQKDFNFSFFVYFGLKVWKFIRRGAAQPFLSKGDTERMEIIIPPKTELERFEKFIKPIFEKIRTNNFQIQTLSKLRDTILPKLMKGQVRVQSYG